MDGVSLNGTNPLEGNYVLDVLNFINELNDSRLNQEFECKKREIMGTKPDKGCDINWDSLLCWPYTPSGMLAKLPCFAELHGIKYDTTRE